MDRTINIAKNRVTEPHWGPPLRHGSKILKGSLIAVSIGIGIVSLLGAIPLVGQIASVPLMAVSHVVDRARNSVTASDELNYRANYYSSQIFTTLGMKNQHGRIATVDEFKAAADINPELAKLYKAPVKMRDKENRSSLLSSAGIAAFGTIFPGGTALAGVGEIGKGAIEAGKIINEAGKVAKVAKTGLHMAVQVGSGMAGTAIADAISGDVVDPQHLLEGIHKTVAEAKSQGMNMREVVSPNLIFMLRVSQDEPFAKALKEQYGKAFHKMNEAEQTQVMLSYPALANAATSEAYAVANGIVAAQELGASKPNLNSNANRYAVGARNSSFADMVQARRAAVVPGVNQAI
ncbi:MAG: hypothetical protein ACOYNL_08240 [Rickettsiales bacterium]